ncbi:MAG: sulfite exporter TauE/SafE family protein [bacterium]
MTPDAMIVTTAFIIGLVGSLHCAGMCGGIVSMLHAGQKISSKRSLRSAWVTSMAFNGGRIVSYAIAGALAASLGVSIVELTGQEIGHTVMQMLGGLFMIALGLYLTGWWNGLAVIEKLGLKVWQKLSPLSRGLLPITSYFGALKAGAMWGWLPCGLVYSALVLVMSSGDPLTGAAAMLAFGMGTLPMLSAIGIASERVNIAAKPLVRQSAGVMVMLFGVLVFTGTNLLPGAHH